MAAKKKTTTAPRRKPTPKPLRLLSARCPSCGLSIPVDSKGLLADHMMSRHRARHLRCPGSFTKAVIEDPAPPLLEKPDQEQAPSTPQEETT